MRKRVLLFLIVLLVLLAWIYRFDLLFRFQYIRLSGLACQEGKTDFINDSCLGKLRVHRVNSTARYEALKGKFAGYETDVNWNTWRRKFDVYHPPKPSRYISLNHFLQKVDVKASLLWLDVRGTFASDTSQILNELNRLDALHNLRMNAVLEIYDTAVANFLAEHDYWIALHISEEWIRRYDDGDWLNLQRTMSPRIAFISQADIHIPILKEHLPGKDIITWSIDFSNVINRARLEKLVHDDEVKMVLVNVKSRFYQ